MRKQAGNAKVNGRFYPKNTSPISNDFGGITITL